MKWRYGRHLESVTLNWKSNSDEYSLEEHSYQISPRSDLKRQSFSFFEYVAQQQQQQQEQEQEQDEISSWSKNLYVTPSTGLCRNDTCT